MNSIRGIDEAKDQPVWLVSFPPNQVVRGSSLTGVGGVSGSYLLARVVCIRVKKEGRGEGGRELVLPLGFPIPMCMLGAVRRLKHKDTSKGL